MTPEKSPLNTQNPEHIIFTYPPIAIAVLGGIRLDGLDRMRVTLKIEHGHKAVRHNLDLYNDNQTEKLIRRAAEKLEIGTSFVSKALAELTTHLEKYRLDEIAKQKTKQEIKKHITEEERKAAVNFLNLPNLLNRTDELIGQSGVIGEETNRLLMYLIFTSRKREHPLHIVSMGSSGAGKTYLQEKVSELIPAEDKVSGTSVTDNALYYYGQHDLKHKLILIEDLTGVQSMLYTLRELESKQKITKILAHKDSRGNTKTISLTVEGPVSIAACTTQESIYEDNSNRSFLIYIDESKEQDERIMEYQRKKSAGKINTAREREVKKLMQNTQRILQPITVINPYAEKLKIPAEVFKPRRSNAHYLQSIEAITYYKQYQREQKTDESTGEVYIETTLEDIAEANALMKEILLRKSDELSGACRNYFEQLKKWMKAENKKSFTNREARSALRENHSNQKRYMLQLMQEGCLYKKIGDQKKGYVYEVVSFEEWNEIQKKITSVLDEILEKPKGEVQSSKEVHSANEPLNSYVNNKQFSKNGKVQARVKKSSSLNPHS
jgi:hypothetical protein